MAELSELPKQLRIYACGTPTTSTRMMHQAADHIESLERELADARRELELLRRVPRRREVVERMEGDW